ncbi:MAG: pyridoxine 5'-phosphate synthase, partial [Planctomycetota bacterium]
FQNSFSDRRHIQDRDVEMLMNSVNLKTNFEMAVAEDVLQIACQHSPDWGLLVPESRQEVTTEGGLNVTDNVDRIRDAVQRLRDAGILVSIFLDPDERQIDAAIELGVDAVELHTGPYALAKGQAQAEQLQRLSDAAARIHNAGLRVHAGHGLNYTNVRAVALIDHVVELNIGHSIVSRAVMVGMRDAVAEMRRLLDWCG